jgi:hypothetical protein
MGVKPLFADMRIDPDAQILLKIDDLLPLP